MGAVLSVLVDRLVDANMQHTNGKELWDALTTNRASNAGSDLYVMESFHDYQMDDNRSIFEQAHEIQCIVKELNHLKIVLPDQFVAGCIIAKLPSTWRNFATVGGLPLPKVLKNMTNHMFQHDMEYYREFQLQDRSFLP
jgi:hypothetical protein